MKSDVKHTPGPWYVGARNGDTTPIAADGPSVVALAVYREDRKPYPMSEAEYAANVRLIAAAPELLSCLQATKGLTDRLLEMDLPHNFLANIRAINLDARDAIAKAVASGASSSLVDRSACREAVCYCHDDSAWIPGETFLDGCSSCGCRWAE